MARPRKLKPAYCHAKDTSRAFVTLNGKRKYVGEYGTQASRDEYDRVVGEWIAAGRAALPAIGENARDAGITVTVLIAGFWDHAQRYYRKPDGTPTSEVDNMRQALRPLRRLYGETSATKFGPLALKALQQHMIKLGWARTFINRQVNRIRMCFKWGVSQELIPSSVYEALRTVSALAAGRSDARESAPVKPVAAEHAAAIFSFLSPQVQAMVELQALGKFTEDVHDPRCLDCGAKARKALVMYTPGIGPARTGKKLVAA
jgi:hypothetical protein